MPPYEPSLIPSKSVSVRIEVILLHFYHSDSATQLKTILSFKKNSNGLPLHVSSYHLFSWKCQGWATHLWTFFNLDWVSTILSVNSSYLSLFLRTFDQFDYRIKRFYKCYQYITVYAHFIGRLNHAWKAVLRSREFLWFDHVRW